MASIYELTSEFQMLWDLMEEGNLSDEALEGAFECTKEELAIKLEGYCKFVKNLESDAKGLKAEEDRLSKRRKTMENTIKRAKDAMLTAIKAAGEKKMHCGSFNVSYQANKPSVFLEEGYIENIPDKYLTQHEPTVNKDLIYEALKDGQACPELEGIAHLEASDSIRIR